MKNIGILKRLLRRKVMKEKFKNKIICKKTLVLSLSIIIVMIHNVNSITLTKTVNVKYFYAKNGQGNPSGDPNWFYYWNGVVGYSNAKYKGSVPGLWGEVPAMYKWSKWFGSKTEMWIYDKASDVNTPHITDGVVTTGIDCFVDTIKHEKVHIDQIKMADLLVPHEPRGWSWNYSPNNHYSPTGVDLDMNDNDVPDSWEPYDIEMEARRAENTPENANMGSDWGDPGKQHKTIKYDD
jgi:hypothetical protein